MSTIYPVPRPITAKPVARIATPYIDKTILLPAAPPADVQLPSLITAPMAPPQRYRL